MTQSLSDLLHSRGVPIALHSAVRELERQLIESQERAKALEEALEPFAATWSLKCQRYIIAKSNWHNEMPGEWPVNTKVRVNDLRRAAALLEKK